MAVTLEFHFVRVTD